MIWVCIVELCLDLSFGLFCRSVWVLILFGCVFVLFVGLLGCLVACFNGYLFGCRVC